MGVMVMMSFSANVSDFEPVAKEKADLMVKIADEGKAAGAVHHCFTEGPDGKVVVFDEWPDEESFHRFFSTQADIPELTAAAGVTGPPTIASYRILDTSDRF